jgi:hypothetical protein
VYVVSWFKVKASTVDDPRLRDVNAEARWLWLCGRCYIAEHLTDGVIHKRAVLRSCNLRKPYEAATALVDAQLWERDGADYFDPSWHEAIRSRAEVEALRRKGAERVAKHRNASTEAPHEAPQIPPHEAPQIPPQIPP